MAATIHNEPSNVAAENGVVFMNGPDGIIICLTPEAAASTSDRLLAGAAQAAEQRFAINREGVEAEARSH